MKVRKSLSERERLIGRDIESESEIKCLRERQRETDKYGEKG